MNKWLIWDFDGTLAYHRRGTWSGSMLYTLQKAAQEWKAEEWIAGSLTRYDHGEVLAWMLERLQDGQACQGEDEL